MSPQSQQGRQLDVKSHMDKKHSSQGGGGEDGQQEVEEGQAEEEQEGSDEVSQGSGGLWGDAGGGDGEASQGS